MSRTAFLFGSVLLAAATPLAARPLTVRQGETWVFEVRRGELVNARRVPVSAKPAKGQVKASLSALMGTSLTLTNATDVGYTFRAELLGVRAPAARTCKLPANRKPILEFWPVKASAVRLSAFKPAVGDGSCPTP